MDGDGNLSDTAPMRGLGTFPRSEVLLGELITNQKLIPAGSRIARAVEILPRSLKPSIQKALRCKNVWCAWTCGNEWFAITALVDDVGSRMHAKPVLQVFLLDGKGRTIGASKWLEVRPNQWTSCES